MTAEHPPSPQAASGIVIYAVGRRAELVLSGAVGPEALPEVERILYSPPLSHAGEWFLDMREVTRFDLASAYALIRAITSRTKLPAVTIHGAPPMVQRTLRHTGVHNVATIT
ncbi:STAS domain-containing protein [Streptomyces sp. NPDC051098]|uniref:STAS domain-containing protein n=1 Tax=Streptomyces sp. NPDC051098 TaxID=3155411 RepID=UPI0034216984